MEPLVGLVALVLLLALLVAAALTYNGFVRRRNRADATWSDLDVLLRRRHDLVPNLVAAVQGYAAHEASVLAEVARTRSDALQARDASRRGDAEGQLGGALKSLLAVAEAYPDLKADRSFVDLQDRLTATEDGIAHARQFYNDAVFAYNTAIQTLPASLLAAALRLRQLQFFQAAGEVRSAVPLG